MIDPRRFIQGAHELRQLFNRHRIAHGFRLMRARGRFELKSWRNNQRLRGVAILAGKIAAGEADEDLALAHIEPFPLDGREEFGELGFS